MKCYKHTHGTMPGHQNESGKEHYHCFECGTVQPGTVWAELTKTTGVTDSGLTVYDSDKECSWCSKPHHYCEQCGKDMNPLGWILGPVCGECCKANHRAATGGR